MQNMIDFEPHSIALSIEVEEAIQKAGHPLSAGEVADIIPGKPSIREVSSAVWLDLAIRGHLILTPDRHLKLITSQ